MEQQIDHHCQHHCPSKLAGISCLPYGYKLGQAQPKTDTYGSHSGVKIVYKANPICDYAYWYPEQVGTGKP